MDNAAFHRSYWVTDKILSFQVPLLYSGPYSYDASAVEKIFAAIKQQDLNPAGRSFKSRTPETYLTWLAEEVARIDFGSVVGLFKRRLVENVHYMLFEDI